MLRQLRGHDRLGLLRRLQLAGLLLLFPAELFQALARSGRSVASAASRCVSCSAISLAHWLGPFHVLEILRPQSFQVAAAARQAASATAATSASCSRQSRGDRRVGGFGRRQLLAGVLQAVGDIVGTTRSSTICDRQRAASASTSSMCCRSCSIVDSRAMICSRLRAARCSRSRIDSETLTISVSHSSTRASSAVSSAEARAMLIAQPLQFLLRGLESFGQGPPFGQRDLRAQLLQAVAVFAVALGLGRLRAHAAQAIPDLFHDVGQPQQVLLHPLQPPLGFDLLGLEPADAGRLFENRPAVLRARPAADGRLCPVRSGCTRRSPRPCRGTGRARP